MKRIIVQEFDYDKISIEVVKNFHHNTKAGLPEDCCLITTPFKTYMANPDDKIIYINDRSYSPSELEEIIDKAEMYDELCTQYENETDESDLEIQYKNLRKRYVNKNFSK